MGSNNCWFPLLLVRTTFGLFDDEEKKTTHHSFVLPLGSIIWYYYYYHRLTFIISLQELMQAIRELDNMRWQTSTGRFISSSSSSSRRGGIQRLAATTALYYAAAHSHSQSTGMAMAYSSSSHNRADSCNSSSNSNILVQALQGGFTEQHPLPTHPYMKIYHVKEPIASTQDEARRLLLQRNENTQPADDEQFIAVVADRQEAGRGTNGRTWESSAGNLYLTVGLPMTKIPVMLTMLPLQIAVLVAERAETILQHCGSSEESQPPRVRVKWPNDVLLCDPKLEYDAKLSGTLIESVSVQNESWFLIGIGINVMHAPPLDKSPGKQIRPAVSLQSYCGENLPEHMALYLGTDLAYAVADWVITTNNNSSLSRTDANQAVLQAWKARAEFGKAYEIRSNDVGEEASDRYRGEQVIAVDIAPDGQLKIRGEDGKERLLVSDYFF